MTVLLALLFCYNGPVLSQPKPLEGGAGIQGTAMILLTNDYRLRLEPLAQVDFFQWLKGKGIGAKLLENPKMRDLLSSFIVFEVRLENKGEDRMEFNPEQLILRNRQGVIGFQVSMADLLRSPYGYSDPDLEQLARLFIHETYNLAPGQAIRHVVAYKPLEKRFPKKVHLLVNRLYYGTVSSKISCQYKVRYP